MVFLQNLIQQLTRMRWSDYADIAIIAFIIYKLLPLLSRPSTRRISLAVIGLVAFAAFTDAANLYTLNFIISRFLQVGLLAVVVIFQPELRRLLDKFGEMVQLRNFLNPSSGSVLTDNMIDQVVSACEVMSRERVGALIVFCRDSRLEDITKTGTPVDAQVSEQLIRNIFFPKAALHDGAMIIRDGRIAAAGCVLPLSESDQLSADLGTRHRAGVGVTESSDALTVIVSEETGIISFASGGQLKRELEVQTLRKQLCKDLNMDAEEELKLPLKLERFYRKGDKRHE